MFGAIFCLVYPLALVWPSGWMWHEGAPYTSQYYMMIVGVYFTLGVFLIRAAANPAAHRSLIQFTIWSSVVDAVIMALQAWGSSMHGGRFLGDVPALLLVAAVLWWLSRYGQMGAAALSATQAGLGGEWRPPLF